MPITTRPVWHHIIMVLGYQPGSKGAMFLPRATFNYPHTLCGTRAYKNLCAQRSKQVYPLD